MITWFVRHPTAANLAMITIVLLGLWALPGLQRETFPAIENDAVQIRVAYRGAAPDEVENAVCLRIEEALEDVGDLDELRCEAVEGVGTATALMREGADKARFLADIKSEIEAIDTLPADAEAPVVTAPGRTDAVVSIAVTGLSDPVILKAYAQALKARMLAIDQIAEVTIDGFSDHHLRIEVSATRLRQFGLTAHDIANTLQRQSVGTPGGRIEGGWEDVLLRVDDQRKSAEALRDLVVISGASGANIRLGQVAQIIDTFDRDEQKILFNGKRAALLHVTKTRNQDILTANRAVKTFVMAEQKRAPQGVELTLTQDVSSVVRDRLDMLLNNGVQGLVLVFLVLWLFFGARYSFWVTMGLPISFLGGLFLLPVFGITINMISMVGLLIGIGLLMDDAIVIAENVAARMAAGDSPQQAAADGVKQVAPGIMSSFGTTLLVFGSLAFISGELGQVLRVMPVVLIVVLSVSLLEAFYLLPNHLAHSLTPKNQHAMASPRAAFERGFARLREGIFGPVLDRAVEYRYITVGIVIMALLLALAVPAGGGLKFVGFPELDGDVVEARILLPQGTPLKRTEAVVKRLTAGIRVVGEQFNDQPGGAPLIENVTVIFGQNPDAFESGPHVARVVVDLLSAELRYTRVDEITAAWRDTVGRPPDVIAIKYTKPAVGPGGRAIDVRFTGEDLHQLKAGAREFQQWLAAFDGVLDLSDDLRPGKREYRITLKPGAGALGVDARQLADEVRSAFQGVKVDEFSVGRETYEVQLLFNATERDSVADLERMTVAGRDGAQVPLNVVADIQIVRGWGRIHRVDGERAVTVQGDVNRERANAQELIDLAKQSIVPKLTKRYPRITVSVEGESAESATTSQSIVRNMLLGLFGVYLLLALQFRSYTAPVAVLIVLPTAFIGMILGHSLMGFELSMPSIVGMASLFGVAVNDSILLVVFIRQRCAAGFDVLSAAKQAGRARFRPILLTSITTVAGLMPLLAETSQQAQVLIPLVTSLAFGLTIATVLALFLVPAVYVILAEYNMAGPREEEAWSP